MSLRNAIRKLTKQGTSELDKLEKEVSSAKSSNYANMSIQERAEMKRKEKQLREMKKEQARKKESDIRKNMTPAEKARRDKNIRDQILADANRQSAESRLKIEGIADPSPTKKATQPAKPSTTVVGPPYDPNNDPAAKSGSPFQRGLDRAEEILGPKGLRTSEMRDVMQRRKQQAEEGIGQEEQLAMKTKLARQMMQAEQTAGLKLGSALGGMTGAATGAQVRSLQAQGLQARAGIERDIFMAQEAAKREGLDKLEATTQFDVGQIGKEKELQATLGLGMERIDAMREAGLLAAEAASRAGGGKK